MKIDINQKYLDFYSKKPHHVIHELIQDDDSLSQAITESQKVQNYNDNHSFCIFNYYSLSNIKRRNESNHAYLNEAQRITRPYLEVLKMLLDYHNKLMNQSPVIQHYIDKVQEHVEFYPFDNGKIYGAFLLTLVFDITQHNIDYFINMMSRKAQLYGYNYVSHQVNKTDNVKFNENVYRCSQVDIQFEAAYVKTDIVRDQEFIWHVTTTDAAEKILKSNHGLEPRSENKQGFSYPSRVYCFVVKRDSLFHDTFANSNRKSTEFIRVEDFIEKLKASYIEFDDHMPIGKKFITDKYTVLRIDTSKLKGIQFYVDNLFEINGQFVAAYTYQHIPSYAISKFGEFTL